MAKKKPKGFHMCSDYKGFGIFSVAVGIVFLAITLLTYSTPVKVGITAFFLGLGVFDLVLFHFYGER